MNIYEQYVEALRVYNEIVLPEYYRLYIDFYKKDGGTQEAHTTNPPPPPPPPPPPGGGE